MPPAPQPPTSSNGFYPPPPPALQQRPPFPGTLPPAPVNGNLYGSVPPASSTPQQAPGPGSVPNLPPNILALLQQSQASPPATAQYGMPPQSAPPGPQIRYAELMTYLVRQLSAYGYVMYTDDISQQNQTAATGQK